MTDAKRLNAISSLFLSVKLIQTKNDERIGLWSRPLRTVSYQYFQYVNTLFRSLLSQDIENQQITSLKYTVIMPRLRQNERNRTFGMLVAGTSVIELHFCFVAFVFLFYNPMIRYN